MLHFELWVCDLILAYRTCDFQLTVTSGHFVVIVQGTSLLDEWVYALQDYVGTSLNKMHADVTANLKWYRM